MQIKNHIATLVLTTLRNGGTIEDVRAKIPTFLLPDALRMYGPRQQFHFTQHPVTGRISAVTFNCSPDNLKDIEHGYVSHLQSDIPKCAIDELSHPEVFVLANPKWAETGYLTYLNQGCEWDAWIKKFVDVSKRYEDKFTFVKTEKTVNGQVFRDEVKLLDDAFFIAVYYVILLEFGIELDRDWFEENVYQVLLKAYSQELANNTWEYVNILTEKPTIPDWISSTQIFIEIEEMVKSTKV